ncbi:MAG: hypothetical protein AAB358_01170 [Patescibacteria group bacterium]
MPENIDQTKRREKRPSGLEIFFNQFFAPIVALIFVAIVIIGYFLVLKIQYAEFVQSRDVDLNRLNQSINDLREKKEMFNQKIGLSVAIDPAEERLLSLALPDGYDFPSILVQLTTLAEDSNFAVKNIEINETNLSAPKAGEAAIKSSVGGQKLKKVNIRMELAGGSYYDWKNLLTNIESSAMIFDILAIEYVPEKSDHTLSLVAYYYSN